MDELVRQALAKWPDVPDCTGWLALDARGRWRAGDAKAGPRQPITHAAMIGFINRNYASAGRYWIFQNGPQRVFVELEYTPFVWRLHPAGGAAEHGAWELIAHNGQSMTPSSLWLDDEGRFLVEARAASGERTIGVVHDHDTALVADLLRDADGNPLDDDALARLSDTEADGRSSGAHDSATSSTLRPSSTAALLQLPLANGTTVRLPLRRIASYQVPTHFGFEPRPSIALRVDVDTRR